MMNESAYIWYSRVFYEDRYQPLVLPSLFLVCASSILQLTICGNSQLFPEPPVIPGASRIFPEPLQLFPEPRSCSRSLAVILGASQLFPEPRTYSQSLSVIPGASHLFPEPPSYSRSLAMTTLSISRNDVVVLVTGIVGSRHNENSMGIVFIASNQHPISLIVH